MKVNNMKHNIIFDMNKNNNHYSTCITNYPSSIIDNNHDEILPTIKWESASDITPKENYEKIGFIILRHVNNNLTNEYWKEAYKCIRKFYKN